MTMLQHAILMLLLPLASAVVIALFLRKQGALASYVSTATAGAIAAIALILTVVILDWRALKPGGAAAR